MMASPEVGKRPRRRWLRRGLRWLTGAVLTSLVGLAVYLAVEDYRARRAIEAAVQALDARDPGWRLEDIEAARAAVPDHENGAPLVVAAAGALPPDWPALQGLADEVRKLQPNERLPDELARRIEQALDGEGAPALRASRELADRARGRHRLTYDRNPLQTKLPHLQCAREVAALWQLEAMRRAHADDAPSALRAARVVLHAGRSIGDEPTLISQLVRSALSAIAAQALERALAQSTPAAADLERWQELAQDEEAVPSYRIAARGDRAMWHAVLVAVASGEVGIRELAEPTMPSWEDSLLGWLGRHRARVALPVALGLHNRIVQAAEAPPALQADLEEQIDSDKQALPWSASLAKLTVPPVPRLGESYRRKQAILRSLATALAAERYRLAHGHWPKDLKQLVPAYLKAVPADPYDGAPLRYGAHPDGVIAYSVARDRQDNGGAWCDNPTDEGCDVGFRLYHPDRRRQPAPAPKEPE